MKTMMTGSTSKRASRAAAILMGVVLAASLASCAPEPGEDIAGAPSKGGEPNSESWSAENPAEVSQKKTELPASFPETAFVIPKDAVIDDTGERSETSWFVVLRAEDIDAGAALWAQVINLGGFTASDEATGENGETLATLTNATLVVNALMIPQEDDTVLLSYDISQF
ncbi:hypothetical protein G7067_09025 [Leucobacter insecticola]|uniref:Uncharacterized protein n=1 Tax=Leucobacter insecticola TaxID=2714934 RepID=A0A6G8FJP5_9MICO|nr:hypothetical protein [Leucobacter insecticola]QIM16523.1 hypothetical protein G7067_09025 [Leucobacter insecticola]